MNRFAALATTLTIAGSALLAPAASADPSLLVSSGGQTIGQGSTAQVGQIIDYKATNCKSDAGVAGYIGQFVDFPDRPEIGTEQFEAQTSPDGSFDLQFEIPEMPQPQHLDVHWYCSSVPVTSMQGAGFLWMSPTVEITIQAAAAPEVATLNLRSATSRTATKATASSNEKPVTVTMDPNALPLIDKLGIVGAKAAPLKAKVDAKVELQFQQKNANLAKQRKPLVSKDDSNATYVKAAFLVVGGKANPTAAMMAPYIARLDGGALRVQIVEDIALTKSPAKTWNK
ncbi:MAG: hypothetical protein JWM47_107 [Acidimicrobiales bacterium]|nr:hypothetical protein [Acidimicrobiales bacterium]